MADEMVSKNFIEEKKTNQKKVFVQDQTEDHKSRDGRSSNFEDLMNSLQDQLVGIDFLESGFDD